MHQVGHWVWNGIAARGGLETSFATRVFPLAGAEFDAAVEQEARRLEMRGVASATVRASYLTFMPLLWERRAIAAYVADYPELMAALPNIEDVDEAIAMATSDHGLDATEQRQLKELLTRFPDRTVLEVLARAHGRMADDEPDPEAARRRKEFAREILEDVAVREASVRSRSQDEPANTSPEATPAATDSSPSTSAPVALFTPAQERRVALGVVGGGLAALFLYGVWPTPWRYSTIATNGRQFPMRINRFSGRVEVNSGSGWKSWGR